MYEMMAEGGGASGQRLKPPRPLINSLIPQEAS
jgi:hypothetical protein